MSCKLQAGQLSGRFCRFSFDWSAFSLTFKLKSTTSFLFLQTKKSQIWRENYDDLHKYNRATNNMANVPELSNFLPTVAHFSRNFGEPPPQWEKILTLTFSLKQWHTSVNMELLSILYFLLEHSQIAKTIILTRCISSNSAVVIIGRLLDRISESSKLTQNPWNDCRHKDDFSLIGISHRIHAKPNLQIRCRHDLESHFN